MSLKRPVAIVINSSLFVLVPILAEFGGVEGPPPLEQRWFLFKAKLSLILGVVDNFVQFEGLILKLLVEFDPLGELEV